MSHFLRLMESWFEKCFHLRDERPARSDDDCDDDYANDNDDDVLKEWMKQIIAAFNKQIL